MAVYRPNTYQVNTGSVVDRTQGLRQALGDVGNLYQGYLSDQEAKRARSVQESRQVEQDAMRKAEYDMRMGEAQRGIDQRDLLNEVGRESMQQMQPHLLAQNEPLLNKLSTGTVEGWKQAEQRAAEKDSRIAEALKQRDAGQLTAEQYEPIRQEILRSTMGDGSTVQAAAVAPFSSYSPIREDADAFVRNRLLNAGVDIDKAGAFAQQATTGLTDRATYQAQGQEARDAAVAAEQQGFDRNLEALKLAQKVTAEQGKLEGRAISGNMSVDEDGRITGVYKSGANKGQTYSLNPKDMSVYDVLNSYDDYAGLDRNAKGRVNALLSSDEFKGIPESVKAGAVKHAVEDASIWFDNRVRVDEDKLQESLNNYKEQYRRTGQGPSIENSIIGESRARSDEMLRAIGSLGTGGNNIPLARSAEQMRDAGPEARLQAFLGMTAPQQAPTSQRPSTSATPTASSQRTTSTAPTEPLEAPQSARLERGDVGVDLEAEFLQTQGLPDRASVLNNYIQARERGDEAGMAQAERAVSRIDQALAEEATRTVQAARQAPTREPVSQPREEVATAAVDTEFQRLRSMYPSADPDTLYNAAVDTTLGNRLVNTGGSQAPGVVTNRLGRAIMATPAALTLGAKATGEGLGVLGESIVNRVPLSVVMQDSEAPARLREWYRNYQQQIDPYGEVRESLYRR